MNVATAANPLVAGRVDSTTRYTGGGLAEDVHDLMTGFESGSWIDRSIGAVATSMDLLGACTDPLGTVTSWGVSWLFEHVRPLSEGLDWLAGDPDQITAYARTWRNVAGAVAAGAQRFVGAVSADATAWTGASSEGFQHHAAEHQRAMQGLAKAADGIAMIVEGAGLLVALVRGLVRDLIAEFVSILAVRLPEWLAEEGLSLGVATPWVVAQVSSLVAKWIAKIARLLHGLSASLRKLMAILRKLGDLIHSLQSLIRTLHREIPAVAQPKRLWTVPGDSGGTPTLARNSPDEATLSGDMEAPVRAIHVDPVPGPAHADPPPPGPAHADRTPPGPAQVDFALAGSDGVTADPLYVAADRSVNVSAITPEPVWRTDDEPLWRHDDRPPSDIFVNGFAPRDAGNTNLEEFVLYDDRSAFVSSTRNGDLEWSRQYRYEIRAPGGIDVDRTLGQVAFPGEAEVAFPGGVAPRFIAGAHRIGFDDQPIPGSWMPNPYFNPI